MSNYTTEIAKAEYACTHLWRSGTTDLIGSLSLLSTGTPTTNADGDAFDESNGATPRTGPANQLGNASGNATDYMTIPPQAFTEMLTAGSGSVLWMGKRNAAVGTLALQNGGYELMCGGGAAGVNSFEFSASLGSPLFTSTNKMAIIITNAGGTAKGVEYIHSGAPLDGQWHQWGFGWDATHLYLFHNGAIVGTLAITAATDLPAIAFAFGLGERLFNGVAQGYKCPWTYQYVSTHTTALTAAQLQTLAARYNGRTGAKVYYPTRFTRFSQRARSARCPIKSIGNSNLIRSTTDPIGPGAQQGFCITIDRLVRAATGNRLVGRHVGVSDPLNNAVYVDGVWSNMFGNTAGTPNNSADPWPVGLYAHDLTEHNRVTTGYNQGFSLASGYIASGAIAGTTSEGMRYDPTDADAPFAATATVVFKMRRATFNAGSGVYTLQVKKVSDNSTIAANNPFSTNTGADTFTTDDTITVGTNLAANYGVVRVTLGGTAVGPVAVGPALWLDTSRSGGFTSGVIWAYGGQPTGRFPIAWKALKATATGESSPDPFTRMGNIISCILTQVGNAVDPTAGIHFAEIQNDINDTGISYTWNGVTFTFDNGTSTGQKRQGCYENMTALIAMFRQVWQALGYNVYNLFFFWGPYHETGDPSDPTSGTAAAVYNINNQMGRALLRICAEDTYETCFIIDGPECLPYATAQAAGMYDSLGPQHGDLALYRALGDLGGAALAPYAARSFTGGGRFRLRSRMR